MSKKQKVTQSEIDGVQYRKAKVWQIILFACNSILGMGVYLLVGMASYSASIGYGIATAAVGGILTGTRILDAVTDPLLAFVYDRVNTKFGKLRILMLTGFAIEALALLGMFDLFSGKGFGMITFILLYVVYVIGYTIINMTIQTIPAILSNDPKQRPTIGVWTTVFNYLIPMILSIVMNAVLLPMCGGTYNQQFLTTTSRVILAIGFIGIILTCIGVSEVDKPESFVGFGKKKEPLKIKDMVDVLLHNRPLQCYIASAASDKIAQQTASQAVINTMLNGIIIGNMGFATILSAVAMLPSIIFAILGAKYAGKHGSRKAIVNWTIASMIFSFILFLFFVISDPSKIASFGPAMIIYVILTFAMNGSKMCVTTANASFMADIIDFELDRSGKYIPAVVSGTYSFVDKIVSSFSALIATGAVALIGYTATMPQPGEASTPGIFWVTMIIYFGLPVFGWICTLVAMGFCKLDREEMVKVQKRIAVEKEKAFHEMVEEHMQ